MKTNKLVGVFIQRAFCLRRPVLYNPENTGAASDSTVCTVLISNDCQEV